MCLASRIEGSVCVCLASRIEGSVCVFVLGWSCGRAMCQPSSSMMEVCCSCLMSLIDCCVQTQPWTSCERDALVCMCTYVCACVIGMRCTLRTVASFKTKSPRCWWVW